MHKTPVFAVALLGLAVSGVAQNCTTPPAQRTVSNRPDFGASFYYGIGNHFLDLDVQRAIQISSFSTWTYDQGVGNPVVPDQTGNTGTVNMYVCPTSRIGNEAISPTTTGSPWTLVGAGTITIVATPGESPIVFNPPVSLAAGQWGIALEYLPTTSGQNPGPLHCLGVNPNPNVVVSDQFVTISNDGIQGTSWTGTAGDSPNLRMTYTPDAASAHYITLGDGCYFRPHAFYDNFPNGATAPAVANTGEQWIYSGSNYIVVNSPVAYVTPTSSNLALGTYGSSSSANWDDALTAPITLPFTFPYPNGSTNTITISSNGHVYLESVVDNSYDVCGSLYGSILPFRDGPAQIAAYFHDLDLTVGGSLHYDIDPNGQFVIITWQLVQEWGVPAAVNTMQLTLDIAGNVSLYLGNLGNQSASNNAVVGFTPGHGASLPTEVNLATQLPYTSGDGSIPPILGMDARPVIGTTPNIVTTNVTLGSLLQVLCAGDQLLPAPVDLGFLGMPGCNLHINPFVFLTNTISPNNTFVQPFAIPNSPALQNQQLTFQAAPLTPGLNALGLLTSNGICTRIGQ